MAGKLLQLVTQCAIDGGFDVNKIQTFHGYVIYEVSLWGAIHVTFAAHVNITITEKLLDRFIF